MGKGNGNWEGVLRKEGDEAEVRRGGLGSDINKDFIESSLLMLI